MSAKPCNRCGRVIVFGREKETDRVIPLSVGSKVYKVIKDDVVELDPKALVPHVCAPSIPGAEPRDFSEPKGGIDA